MQVEVESETDELADDEHFIPLSLTMTGARLAANHLADDEEDNLA